MRKGFSKKLYIVEQECLVLILRGFRPLKGRTIPPYLLETGGKAETYDSVSYNWGGFEFNKK